MADDSDGDPWPRLRALPMGREVEIVDREGRTWRGTLVPSHAFSSDRVVQLKLASGYNVGVRVDPGSSFRPLGAARDPDSTSPEADPSSVPSPERSARSDSAAESPVLLLSTGGTIASRVDYRTGGVRPVDSEREILEFYPGLDRDGPVVVRPVFDLLSENIGPEQWTDLARHVVRAFREGARGVVIAHGTDTLTFTAAALSFLLRPVPGPVVLVGAQRSPDRPSSDGAANLLAAVRVARHPDLAEVVVAMHEGPSDTRVAIHRGTRVRKMHSTRRDAFETRNGGPLGYVEDDRVHLDPGYRKRNGSGADTIRADALDPRGVLVWFYPGLEPEAVARAVEGKRGAVLAGTGLGHTASSHLGWIRDAAARGLVLAMTTQCLGGTTDPYVYETGRELLRAGVLYLGDMLPEAAYAKLLWALGQSERPERVRELLLEDRAGERADRRELDPRASPT